MLIGNITNLALAATAGIQQMSQRWSARLAAAQQNTNVLAFRNSVYVATYGGSIFKYEPLSGKVLAHSFMLSANEVRLASSPNECSLIVATSDNIASRDPLDLSWRWSTELPDVDPTAKSFVFIFCTAIWIYAGTQGYIYRLSYNGDIEDSYDIRIRKDLSLSISDNESTLFVGINGQIYAFDAENFSRGPQWAKSLDSAGNNYVSVVGGNSAVYAGSRGRVYQLQENTGTQIHYNGLKSVGNSDVTLTLYKPTNTLFVGTNGFAIGLDSRNIEGLYFKTSLKSSGYHSTDVAVLSPQYALFGSNGRLYQLDRSGNTVAALNLGLGWGMTRIAAAPWTNGRIVVAVFGFASGLLADLGSSSSPLSSISNTTDASGIGSANISTIANSSSNAVGSGTGTCGAAISRVSSGFEVRPASASVQSIAVS